MENPNLIIAGWFMATTIYGSHMDISMTHPHLPVPVAFRNLDSHWSWRLPIQKLCGFAKKGCWAIGEAVSSYHCSISHLETIYMTWWCSCYNAIIIHIIHFVDAFFTGCSRIPHFAHGADKEKDKSALCRCVISTVCIIIVELNRIVVSNGDGIDLWIAGFFMFLHWRCAEFAASRSNSNGHSPEMFPRGDKTKLTPCICLNIWCWNIFCGKNQHTEIEGFPAAFLFFSFS